MVKLMPLSSAVYLLYLFCTLWKVNETSEIKKLDYVFATLSSGVIQGFRTRSKSDRDVIVFKKIPFAQPPIDNLRFQRLQPIIPWRGILNATEFGPACFNKYKVDRSENCIHVNVFADAECFYEKRDCPVIFYVHPGGLVSGSTITINETQIIEKYASDGLIFVSPAYRIGIFGVIDIPNATSNTLALDDVVFAANWITKEIQNFGGSREKITALGHSTGATLISLLLASDVIPQSTFNKAILASAVVIYHPNREFTNEMLKRFKCYTDDSDELFSPTEQLECLQKIDAHDLHDAELEIMKELSLTFHYISPSGDFSELLQKNLKGRPLLITTTLKELPIDDGNRNKEIIYSTTKLFGYRNNTDEVQRACLERIAHKKGEDLIDAEAAQLAIANTKAGGKTFTMSFRLENRQVHASDILFFDGFHLSEEDKPFTPAEELMDVTYPTMLKNFVKYETIFPGWEPNDDRGHGYYVLDFKISNGSVIRAPYFCPGINNPGGTIFFLHDLANINANLEVDRRPIKVEEYFDSLCDNLGNVQKPFHQLLYADMNSSSFTNSTSDEKIQSKKSDLLLWALVFCGIGFVVILFSVLGQNSQSNLLPYGEVTEKSKLLYYMDHW